MENKAQTEHITNSLILSFHVFDINDLRCDITWSSATDKQIFLSIRELSQAEISNWAFEAVLWLENDVLGFEVSVHDLFAVHLFESLQDAVHNCSDLVGCEFVFGFDLVIELSSFQQLHNNIKRVVRLEDLV